MFDLLSSVPAWAWWMLGVFGWLSASLALAGIWRAFNDEFWDTPGPLFASLIFPMAIWYFIALAAMTVIRKRRLCPKCKSRY